MTVLHVISRSHITAGYFHFVQSIGNSRVDHIALVPPGDAGWEPASHLSIVRPSNRLRWLWNYLRLATTSQKIFVHGIAGGWVTIALATAPWVLQRVYWLIWGADLYSYRRRNASNASRTVEVVRRFVIRRIGHLLTYLDGDVELARTWYGARGQKHQCLLYPGNTFSSTEAKLSPPKPLRVQVGHSADPENHHDEVFRAIAAQGNSFVVVVPLVYGDDEYRKNILDSGRLLFGDRFLPQLSMLSYPDYLEQLHGIDIAIFNHRRQQAMGNTIALLGMGKRVFIRNSTSQWDLLHGAGMDISAIEDGITLDRLPPDIGAKNTELVEKLFSRDRLADQWREILNG